MIEVYTKENEKLEEVSLKVTENRSPKMVITSKTSPQKYFHCCNEDIFYVTLLYKRINHIKWKFSGKQGLLFFEIFLSFVIEIQFF